jgi:hypothetical protein
MTGGNFTGIPFAGQSLIPIQRNPQTAKTPSPPRTSAFGPSRAGAQLASWSLRSKKVFDMRELLPPGVLGALAVRGFETALGQVCWGCRLSAHFAVALRGLRVVYTSPLAPSLARAARAPGKQDRGSPGGDEDGWRIGGLPLVSGAQDHWVPHLWRLGKHPGATWGGGPSGTVSRLSGQGDLSVHGLPGNRGEAGRTLLGFKRLEFMALR